MDAKVAFSVVFAIATALSLSGCYPRNYEEQGALMGGLLGAGTGAIIGDQSGNAAAGALIGAGIGGIGGGAVGRGMDDVDARNRAMIAAQLGRQVPPGAATIDDVLMMTQAGVQDDLIVNHIRANGMSRPLTAQDLVSLQTQGVSPNVIKAMQEPPPARQTAPVVIERPSPAPVIVEEYHYGPPCYHPPFGYRRRHWHRPPSPGFSWGFSYRN